MMPGFGCGKVVDWPDVQEVRERFCSDSLFVWTVLVYPKPCMAYRPIHGSVDWPHAKLRWLPTNHCPDGWLHPSDLSGNQEAKDSQIVSQDIMTWNPQPADPDGQMTRRCFRSADTSCSPAGRVCHCSSMGMVLRSIQHAL